MAHMVKCTVCKQTFDRDKVQAVKVSANRYAHYTCKPDGGELMPLKETDPDLIKLKEYVANLLGEECNYAKVTKQIKDFVSDFGFTYSGILKSLIWYYDIKGNPKDKTYGGIGIVPFIYKEASNYYYHLYLAQIANESISSYQHKVKEIEIESPNVYTRPPKMFNSEDEV